MRYKRTHHSKHDYSMLEPRHLLAGADICAGAGDNVVVIRLSAANNSTIEVEVDGMIAGTFAAGSQSPITINTEDGNDTILLDHSNGIPSAVGGIVLDGGAGTDQLATNNSDDGFFVLEQQFNFDGSLDGYLTFMSVESLQGGPGADRFDIRSIDSDISVDGRGNGDVFRLGSVAPDFFTSVLSDLDGNISIEGGTGQNRILMSGRGGAGLDMTIESTRISGHNDSFAIDYQSTGGSFSNIDGSEGGITIFGSQGLNNTVADDNFNIVGLLPENTLKLRTGAGNDRFFISDAAAGDVLLDVGGGEDQTEVEFQGFGDRQINFDLGRGDKIFTAFGTDADDEIERRAAGLFSGDEFLEVPAFEEVNIFTRAGNDTVRVLSDAPGLRGTIDGGTGNDTIAIQPNGTTSFVDLFGGDGDDFFDIEMQANVGTIDGQNGSDRYLAALQDSSFFRRVSYTDTGNSAGDFDEILMLLTQSRDDVRINSSFIDVDSREAFIFSGMEFSELDTRGGFDFVSFGTEFGNVQLNKLDTGAGNDEIRFLMHPNSADSQLEIEAGSGDNRFSLSGTGNFLYERITVNTVFEDTEITAIGNLGGPGVINLDVLLSSTDGTFNLDGRGIDLQTNHTDIDLFIDGLHESDSVRFGLGGTTFRANARISEDVFGDVDLSNLTNSTVFVAANGTARTISVGPSGERTKFFMRSGSTDDLFTISNHVVEVGEERFVGSDAIDDMILDGGGGDDEFFVEATAVRTTLLGRAGDDIFRTSSNLNSIDGRLLVFSGEGNDSLIVDDSAAGFGYDYFVGRNSIAQMGPGRDFAGIVFGNAALENLTLRTSLGNNLVRIKPTSTTQVSVVDGGGTSDHISLASDPFDGHQLMLDTANSGFWTFDHGYKDLFFDGFESQQADDV